MHFLPVRYYTEDWCESHDVIVFGWGGGIDLFPDGDRLQVVDPLRDLFTDEEYQGFLRGSSVFVVTDGLVVTPMSLASLLVHSR